MKRRAWMLSAAAGLAAWQAEAAGAHVASDGEDDADRVRRGRALAFPRDHGAHPGAAIEWWYITGWTGTEAAPQLGFQLTFFRSRTGLAEGNPSRFAARQLLFAHAAVTDLAAGRHHHAARIARWSGGEARPAVGGPVSTSAMALASSSTSNSTSAPVAAPASVSAFASRSHTELQVGRWQLRRDGARCLATLPADDFMLDLQLQPSQPLLLQGEAGFSRKGPDPAQASHYYSEPQLGVAGRISVMGRDTEARGRAWLDHEWSDQLLHPEAVGWDWLGINLFDGSALTAFRLRRSDGSALWAGGSFRTAGGPVRAFAPDGVRLTPGRRWRSPATAADYPVQWTVDTPAGRFALHALLDAQELDSRASTGSVYWEGLSELLDSAGRRVGLGYLELTGYAAPLRLG